MDVQQTSLDAYQEIKSSGVLGFRQKQIYDCLRTNGPLTDKELSSILHLPINCITPRRGELEKEKHLIESAGIISCPKTGHKTNKWRIK